MVLTRILTIGQQIAKRTKEQLLKNRFTKRLYAQPYDQFVDFLTQTPTCAYTDENPWRAPETFARFFKEKKMLSWLYNNHNHPIFKNKQTTAIHTLVRLRDTNGIRLLASDHYNLNIIEAASGLNSLNLLTGMHSDNASRVLYHSQKERLWSNLSCSLFSTLCQHGAAVDITTLAHVMTGHQPRKLQQLACHYFYQQHFKDEISNLIKQLSFDVLNYRSIFDFNTYHMRMMLVQIKSSTDHPLMQQYKTQQLEEIFEVMIKKLSQLMTNPDYLQSYGLDKDNAVTLAKV